jgi:hypothetical protein
VASNIAQQGFKSSKTCCWLDTFCRADGPIAAAALTRRD